MGGYHESSRICRESPQHLSLHCATKIVIPVQKTLQSADVSPADKQCQKRGFEIVPAISTADHQMPKYDNETFSSCITFFTVLQAKLGCSGIQRAQWEPYQVAMQGYTGPDEVDIPR